MFKNIGTQTIETERLILRKFKADDVEDVFKYWASNPKVQLEYGEPVYSTKEQVQELINKWILDYDDNGFYRWAIVLKESNVNIGQIAFCRVYEEVATAEIEYCIGEDFWGNRYALEALNSVIEYMLCKSDFKKLEAFHREANPKSGRVLEKTVMKRVPTVRRFEISGESTEGEICYAITKEEYFSNKGKSMLNIKFRAEKPEDYRVVEELTREAFWNHHVPGCDEHYLVHIMRNSKAFIKELDMVAIVDDIIVANIMYTKAKILCDNGQVRDIISFGPISVLPNFQGKGIGSMLIEHTKVLARNLGYSAILIYGDPNFYSRVGFITAENFGIGTADDMYAVPLQACELIDGALSDCKGRFIEASIYEIDESEAKKFDENFETKELKENLPSQIRFLQLVKMRTPR